MFTGKYGVAKHFYINISKAGSANHAVGADWTPAAGDVKISKDGGAAANVTNLPVAIAMGNSAIWDFSLTATEMQAAQINITVADSVTKAVDDTGFVIGTYGNASANLVIDFGINQTGDSFARLGAPAGASIAADIATRMATYTQPTGFLASSFPASLVASSSEVAAIQNNTRTVIVVPNVIERPDSGTQAYKVRLYLYDEVGNMEAPDSTPTAAIANAAGTDLSARLGAASNLSTGVYEWTYTADVAHTLEQLLWTFTVVEGGATRLFGRESLIVDVTAVDFTSSDRTNLNTILTRADVATSTRMATFTLPTNFAAQLISAGGVVSADMVAISSDGTAADNLEAACDGTGYNLGNGSIVAASVTAAVATTSNVKKNQALSNFEFMMTDSTTHAPSTGKTVTVTRSIDGAPFAAGTLSAVTELSNGIYKVNFAAADLNGNVITLKATATSCDDTFERIITQP